MFYFRHLHVPFSTFQIFLGVRCAIFSIELLVLWLHTTSGRGCSPSCNDGQPDSQAAMKAQYDKWRPAFSAGLRAALGPDALMIANSGSGIADPALNGLTIEDQECSGEGQSAAWFEAQAAVAHAPPIGVLWLKSGSTAECASAAKLRERFPWLLEGTDFYDGGRVVCNHTV